MGGGGGGGGKGDILKNFFEFYHVSPRIQYICAEYEQSSMSVNV